MGGINLNDKKESLITIKLNIMISIEVNGKKVRSTKVVDASKLLVKGSLTIAASTLAATAVMLSEAVNIINK